MVYGDICCCGPRAWSKGIGRFQVIVNAAGFILFGVVLIGLLKLGENGFNDIESDGNHPNLIQHLSYAECLITLLISLGVFLVGCLFGFFLLKGNNEDKTGYLRWWIAYAVVCSCWSMFYTILYPNTLKIISMILSAAMYGFGIYVVRSLIHEIEQEKKFMKQRYNCKSKLLPNDKPLSYKYTLFSNDMV